MNKKSKVISGRDTTNDLLKIANKKNNLRPSRV